MLIAMWKGLAAIQLTKEYEYEHESELAPKYAKWFGEMKSVGLERYQNLKHCICI